MRRFSCFLLLLAPIAFAQGQPVHTITYKLSSGTGFVINNEGHVVTNKHVVKDCRSISILTLRGESQATLVAEDEERDLAVLKTTYIPQRYAPLRFNLDSLRVGDRVSILGFPGSQGANGYAQFRNTTIKSLHGPTGENFWIQLTSVTQHGNSGGPVLDESGHVIAVLSGVALAYLADKTGQATGSVVGKSDVAITLPALRDFLREHAISFYESDSSPVGIGEATLRDDAQHFIVPVRCVVNAKEK